MKVSTICAILVLAWPTSLPAQDSARATVQASDMLRKGAEAMASHLWEVAAQHYESLLSQTALSEKQRTEALLKLAEALIRDGKPDQALDIIEQSILQAEPETSFWRGQALAATGRFAQAVEILKERLQTKTPEPLPYRIEAGLTASSLELALDLPQEALKTLSLTSEGLKGSELQRIRLRQINILLDLGRVEEARELMPTKEQVATPLQSIQAFTEAAILLRENRNEEAAGLYQQLVENPQNLSQRQHHETWVGWADALLAQNKRSEAAELLLNYVQKYPESTLLEEIFKRLTAALPEQPSPSDPILTRLQSWIEVPELPELGLISNQDSFAVSAWPTSSKLSDLSAFSLYTRAIGLHRQATDLSKFEAEALLKRLYLEAPTHFLASRALLTLASWHLEDKKLEDAHHLLITLRETATSPLIKGRAAFQQALSIAGTGGQAMEAAELYQQASELLQGINADTARFNGALIHLIQADTISDKDEPSAIKDPLIAANLELERALANTEPTRRQIAIESFLLAHPDHPRAPEARVNAAEAALQNQPPDLSSARAQIETLESDPEKFSSVSPARIALIKLRVFDLEDDSDNAITTARTLMADFPASVQAIEASFILGRKLYETGNYNDARIALEKLAGQLSDSHRIQTAWLLAARSAALIPTSQSQQEALGLFDKAIQTDGPLVDLAKLEKARLMIDMNLLNEAATYLKPWYEGLAPEDPLKLASGLLLAEAIYAQGKLNPDSLPLALAIYEQLIATSKHQTPEHDRLQYLRGLTLEQLPDPQLPDQKRDKEALIAYYSVLERENPPAQWEYFEASGFRALALLEKARRWPAAIACAKKIASFKGPRKEEAAARAKQIQLKYMIWED